MNISPIAAPYAKALFGLSVEKNQLEETLKDMKLVASVYEECLDFRQMLKSPLINEGKKKTIISMIFEKLISKMTFTFLMILIRKKREAYIGDIAFEFIELYKDYKGILSATLKTAVPASEDLLSQFRELLKTQAEGEIELAGEVNPELIGGFILRWKDKQYNASIQKQIARLQRGVTRINLYKKGF